MTISSNKMRDRTAQCEARHRHLMLFPSGDKGKSKAYFDPNPTAKATTPTMSPVATKKDRAVTSGLTNMFGPVMGRATTNSLVTTTDPVIPGNNLSVSKTSAAASSVVACDDESHAPHTDLAVSGHVQDASRLVSDSTGVVDDNGANLYHEEASFHSEEASWHTSTNSISTLAYPTLSKRDSPDNVRTTPTLTPSLSPAGSGPMASIDKLAALLVPVAIHESASRASVSTTGLVRLMPVEEGGNPVAVTCTQPPTAPIISTGIDLGEAAATASSDGTIGAFTATDQAPTHTIDQPQGTHGISTGDYHGNLTDADIRRADAIRASVTTFHARNDGTPRTVYLRRLGLE